MEETEYLKSAILSAKESLTLLPTEFQRLKRESERLIDQICERAGITGEIQAVKDDLEKARTKLQSQADILQGQISALESVYSRFHSVPVVRPSSPVYNPPVEPYIEESVYDAHVEPSVIEEIEEPDEVIEEGTDDDEYLRVMEEELKEFESRVANGTASEQDLEAIKALSALAQFKR